MKNVTAYVQALLCALISAALAIMGKSLIASISPVILLFLRLSIACIGFLPFVKLHTFTQLNRSNKLMLILAGVIGVFAGNLLFYFGLTYSSAFNASLINALTPILTLMGMCLYLRILPTRMVLFSFFLAFVGVLMVITNGSLDMRAFVRAKGNIILLLATATSVIYSLAAKHKTAALTSSAFALGSFVISVALLTPLALHGGLLELLPTITLVQWLMIGFLALAGSTLGFYLFTQSMMVIGPEITAYIVYSMAPLFVMVVDLVFLKKPASLWKLAGTACILASLLLQLTLLSQEEKHHHLERHK